MLPEIFRVGIEAPLMSPDIGHGVFLI